MSDVEFKGLAAPARRALASAGFAMLQDLNGASEARLVQLHGMGPNGLKALKALLAARGWALRP